MAVDKKIKPVVGILMGSDSDLPVMEEAVKAEILRHSLRYCHLIRPQDA